MARPVHVLGIAGSLRRASWNRGLLRAAVELAPEGMTIETFDIAPIPLYNYDIEVQGFPEPVQRFKERIAAADALLIVTPEYNFSIPGVLKNAIDWASRPHDHSPLTGKPVAFMGAGGYGGTMRAQIAWRQVCMFTNMHPINEPGVYVRLGNDKFDENGNLIDDSVRPFIRTLLGSLLAWTRRLRGDGTC
jgi:chromate reductase